MTRLNMSIARRVKIIMQKYKIVRKSFNSFIISLFFVWLRDKNPFFDWADAFLFYFEFSIFSKLFFAFFLMIGSKYLNRMSSIRKRIKIPIFSKKKKISTITVHLLLTKTKSSPLMRTGQWIRSGF